MTLCDIGQKCISLFFHQKLPKQVILINVSFSLFKIAINEVSQNITFLETAANKLIAEQNSKRAILRICQFLTKVFSVR